MSRAQAVLICWLLVTACAASDETGPHGVVVRDSAGIRIIESGVPAWADGEEWRIGPELLVEFGRADGLHRIVAAFRLDDGRIVVAHASGPEFLVYSREGKLVARHGGRGAGPGEYREFTRVRRGPTDSLVVFDLPGLRISVLDPVGRFVRSVSAPLLPDGTLGLLEDVFADGSLLVTPARGPPAGKGLVRRNRVLWRVSQDGRIATRIAEFPELEMFFFEHVPRPVVWRRPFFGHTAYYVAGAHRLYWGATDAFQIHVHSFEGGSIELFRKRHDVESFGRRDVARLIEERIRIEPNANMRPLWRRILEELPTSGTVPAFGWPDYGSSHGPALQLDDDGNLWVAEYSMPGEVGNRRTVFDRNGVWLGTVVLPPRFSPLHIGADFVLGVWRDELDVEHIRLYELIKPAGLNSRGIHSGTPRVPARAGSGTGVANSRASGAVGPHVRRVEEISLGDDSTQWEIGCVGGASSFRGCSSSRL